MAHYGRLLDYRFGGDVDDIRGATLYGLDDEKLGKIDDVIFDHTSGTIQYAVVDSGGWLNSKKFLVSADRIQPDAEHKDDFYARMTKEQIESLPRYDEDKFSQETHQNESYWSDYDERYRKSLETTGDPEKLDEFIAVMRSYGEIDVTRSGSLAIALESKKLRLQPPVPTRAEVKVG